MRHLLSIALLGLAGCGGATERPAGDREKAEFHYNLAYGHMMDVVKPNAHAALREVTQALELDPDYPEAHMLAGIIYMGREGYVDAAAHFQEALRLRPEYLDAQNNLGATYLAMGRWDDAIPIFEKLAGNALYKSPGLALNNLGWAYYNKTDLKKARFKFLEAIAYNNLAMVQIDEGRLEKAKKTLERGIKRCKSYAEPHFHLGRVAHRQGDLEGARKHFGRCLELAGDSHLADRCEQRLKALPPSVGRR